MPRPKAGINILTECNRNKLWQSAACVCNAVLPGLVLSPAATASLEQSAELKQAFEDNVLTPQLGQPEEVATVIAFLASDGASYINGEFDSSRRWLAKSCSALCADSGSVCSRVTMHRDHPRPFVDKEKSGGVSSQNNKCLFKGFMSMVAVTFIEHDGYRNIQLMAKRNIP